MDSWRTSPSLCTLEFETRQAPTVRITGCWTFDLYKPVTWEFARYDITYNVMSKRKLNKLVTDGLVADGTILVC